MNSAENADHIPSRGFTKLDSGILFSSIWQAEHDVVRVWIGLLAMCDANGLIRASVPALAHLNFVTVERLREIFEQFKSPDENSRTTDFEGRRLKEVSGGFLVINYARYRNLLQRKAGSHAERQERYRKRNKGDPPCH